MKLSTLIELANAYKIQKNNKLNENRYKPINEAYYSSIFTKYHEQFSKNQYNNALLLDSGGYRLQREHNINKIIVEPSRLYLINNLTLDTFETKINDIIYETDDVNKINKDLEHYVNNLTFDKQYISTYITECEKIFNTKFSSPSEIITYIKNIIQKYNVSFYDAYKKIEGLPTYKISDIKTQDLQLISIKEARQTIHRDDILFWEDTKGELIAISYDHVIKMYIDNSDYLYKNCIYVYDPTKTQPDKKYISSITEPNIRDNYHKQYTFQQLKYSIASFIYFNYCQKFSTNAILYDKAIKEKFYTLSTDVFANDVKRMNNHIPEIGAIYALSPKTIKKYNNKAELKFREANNQYYQMEASSLNRLKALRQKYVKLAKSAKEYTAIVDSLDELSTGCINLLSDISIYMKENHSQIKEPSPQNIYQPDIITFACTNAHYIIVLSERVQELLMSIFPILEKIGEFKSFSNVLKVKSLPDQAIQLLLELKGLVNNYQNILRKITPNTTFNMLKELDTDIFDNVKSLNFKNYEKLFDSVDFY